MVLGRNARSNVRVGEGDVLNSGGVVMLD